MEAFGSSSYSLTKADRSTSLTSNSGVYLYMRRCGDILIILEGKNYSVWTTSDSISLHWPCLQAAIIQRIPVLMHLMIRSIYQLVWRCIVLMRAWWMPWSFKYHSNSPRHSLTWSDLTFMSKPYPYLIILWKHLAVSILFNSHSTAISTHLVNGSTTTIILQ